MDEFDFHEQKNRRKNKRQRDLAFKRKKTNRKGKRK
jgi:hypothetical protein